MKRRSSYLQYHWYMYLLWAMAMIALWCYLFYYVSLPERNEQMNLVVFDRDFPAATLQWNMSDGIEEITDQSILSVRVEAYGELGSSIHDLLMARLIISDIIIVPESLLTSNKEETDKIRIESFRRLPTDELNAMVSGLEYYTADGVTYGVYLTIDDGITNNFESYLEDDERYVLFFSDESPNLDRLFGLGEKGDCAGIDALKYLLEDVNG